MLSSKERSTLRSLASAIKPIGQTGKEGITESVIGSVSEALNARELIKITVLQNSSDSPEEIGRKLAEKLNAECVCVTGRKVVLYRFSDKPNIKHIEYKQ